MIKKNKTHLGAIVFLACLFTNFQTSANTTFDTAFRQLTEDILIQNLTLSPANIISTKAGEKYDESKDPALRKGTENWEQPQSSFFAVPALVIGVIGLVLFFNREK